MTKHKLIPIEPTPEMVEAAEAAYMPFGDMYAALQLGIMAAPDHIADVSNMVSIAKQPEPVAYAVFAENGNIKVWCADPAQTERLKREHGEQLQALYAEPLINDAGLLQLLRECQPVMQAHVAATHMLEGFKPKRNRWDSVIERVNAALAGCHHKQGGQP